MKHQTAIWVKAIIAGIAATLVCAFAIVMLSSQGDSPDLSYRSADYQVKVLANGDLKITEHIDVKLNVSYLLRVVANNLSCPTNDIEVASNIIVLLHILNGLVSTINDKLAETLQDVKQRHCGILCLLGIE